MTPEKIVAQVLYPWVLEMQGVKFAYHDAMRQAEEVVTALKAKGYLSDD